MAGDTRVPGAGAYHAGLAVALTPAAPPAFRPWIPRRSCASCKTSGPTARPSCSRPPSPARCAPPRLPVCVAGPRLKTVLGGMQDGLCVRCIPLPCVSPSMACARLLPHLQVEVLARQVLNNPVEIQVGFGSDEGLTAALLGGPACSVAGRGAADSTRHAASRVTVNQQGSPTPSCRASPAGWRAVGGEQGHCAVHRDPA